MTAGVLRGWPPTMNALWEQGIPGPRSLAPAGDFGAFRRDSLEFLRAGRDRYGDLFAFRLFHIPGCAVLDPALVQDVLVRHADRVAKPRDLFRLRVAFGDGLLTSEGEHWQRQRALVQRAFHAALLDRYAPAVVRATRAHLGRVAGAPIDPHERMMAIALEAIAEVLFGDDLAGHLAVVEHALQVFVARFAAMMSAPIPIPLNVPTPGNLHARRVMGRLDRVIHRVIDARRRRDDPGEDVLGFMLREAPALSTKQLRDDLVTLLFAGHETSALALGWALHLLSTAPAAQERLAREVGGALGEGEPEVASLARAPFLKAVVDETLRLYPPVWGISRKPTEPVDLGGYTIPTGTMLFLCPYVQQRDARHFPDPDAFQPERWLEGGRQRPHRFASFPFSGGPRTCVGVHFAMMELQMVLALLLREHRVEPATSAPVTLQPLVTLRPGPGLRVRLTRAAG